MNKKIKKVFKGLDSDVQEAIKFLINEIDYNATKNIDVRASSDSIYKKMSKKLVNF